MMSMELEASWSGAVVYVCDTPADMDACIANPPTSLVQKQTMVDGDVAILLLQRQTVMLHGIFAKEDDGQSRLTMTFDCMPVRMTQLSCAAQLETFPSGTSHLLSLKDMREVLGAFRRTPMRILKRGEVIKPIYATAWHAFHHAPSMVLHIAHDTATTTAIPSSS